MDDNGESIRILVPHTQSNVVDLDRAHNPGPDATVNASRPAWGSDRAVVTLTIPTR